MALSKYCSSNCTITPLDFEGEKARQALGFTGPQNHINEKDRSTVGNHSSASMIRAWLGDEIFFSYRKLAIHRDPLDFLISQYFYRMQNIAESRKTPFREWINANQANVLENYRIAPMQGQNSCDVIFDYDALYSDINKCGFLPHGFSDLLRSLSFKSNVRSKDSRDPKAFFSQNGVDPKQIVDLLNSSNMTTYLSEYRGH